MENEHGRGPTHGPTTGHGGGDGHGHTDAHGRVDERQHVWDNPRNVKLLFNVFYAACAIVLVFDPLLGLVIDRHRGHAWESMLGFYPLYGFFGIVILVLVAKLMRAVLMRPEDYYDRSADGGADGGAGGSTDGSADG